VVVELERQRPEAGGEGVERRPHRRRRRHAERVDEHEALRAAPLDDLREEVEAVVERAAEEVPAHEDRPQAEVARGGEALLEARNQLGPVDVVDVAAEIRIDRVLDDHGRQPGGRARLDVARQGTREAHQLRREAELGDGRTPGRDLG
jgi:hypothetical protein